MIVHLYVGNGPINRTSIPLHSHFIAHNKPHVSGYNITTSNSRNIWEKISEMTGGGGGG